MMVMAASDRSSPDVGSLSPMELAILDFETSWSQQTRPVAKDSVIRSTLDVSATRYYQVLNVLIDKPAALAAQPLTVARLLRRRDEQRARRSAQRLGVRIAV